MTMNEKTLDEGRGWVDAVQQPNLAAGGNGGGGTYRVTIPHGTYGGITYTIVGAGGGGGSAPPAEPTDPQEQLPSTPIAIAVFVLVFVLTWAALQWL